jgi:capsular polysaccharide biosynthesis protein
MDQLFNEVRAALYAVWHRRWIALGAAWAVCLLGWLVIAMIPNSYESKARIYVDVDDVLSKQLGIAGDGKQEIMRVRQTLASAKNLEKVVTATRLGEGITERSDLELAIANLETKVKVTSEQDALFEITATISKRSLSDAENAMLARDVVQKLLDIFREEHISGNRAGISEAITDLERQLEERKRELENAEERRIAFEAEFPDMVGGTDSLSSKVQQTRAELRNIDADIAAAQSALAAIRGQISGMPRTIADAANPLGAGGALLQAQTQLAELRARADRCASRCDRHDQADTSAGASGRSQSRFARRHDQSGLQLVAGHPHRPAGVGGCASGQAGGAAIILCRDGCQPGQ